MKNMLIQNKYTFISLVIICGMFAMMQAYYDPSVSVKKPLMSDSAKAEGYGTPAIGGPFTLIDHNGKTFTHENLLGKYALVFFGFTYCPDVCPTALSKLAQVYEDLSETATKQLNVAMISIDPARDTVETMAGYVPAFNENFIGLTGTAEQVKKAAKSYLVYYAKEEGQDAQNYTVNHSGYIYLMGPQGDYIKHFSHKTGADEITQTMQQLLYK